MTEKLLDDRLDLRVNRIDKRNFVNKCRKSRRDPSQLQREFIEAYNEGKLRIITNEKIDGELYQCP